MAFKVSNKEIKIATEDIIVWKAIFPKDGKGWFYDLKDKDGNFISWEKGWIYTEDNFPDKVKKKYLNEGGYHSLKNSKSIILRENQKVVKMYIPKGSRYLENRIEYFSESLMYI